MDADARIQALNRDLEKRISELGVVNRELEAFSYSVSHDRRAPLRAIDGSSQALLDDCGEQLAATVRMAELIDDLLDLSRVTRREMQNEPVDLSALTTAIGAQLQRSEPGRHVELSVSSGLRARGDPHLLRLVLENLLGNAWKFTSGRSDARVEFGATSADGARAYFVRDNGVGFDMAYADKLFGAFQRLHGANESPVPVSVWPPCSESSFATAVVSGRTVPSARARRSTSHSELRSKGQTCRLAAG
jgi:signal transduction histidine kinase